MSAVGSLSTARSKAMRLIVTLLVLLVGCQANGPPSKDYFYRSSVPLPRHQAFVKQPIPQAAPQRQPQYTFNTTNYSTTNNYNYGRQPLVAHRVHCNHIRVPINEQRWQVPVYKPCFRGYDACGLPIYAQELLTPGGLYKITIGYRCRRCGCRL